MFNDILNKQGLTIERLRRFCEMVEAGTMAKAVEQNDREQPAYSRDLKALEDYFEEDLFKREGSTRSGKALQGLTLRGDLLHRTALRFFTDIERVINYNEATNSITLGAEESLLHFLLCPRISEIQTACPESKICFQALEKQELLRALSDHKIHFAISSSSAMEPDIEEISFVSLGTLHFKAYATKNTLECFSLLPEEELIRRIPLITLPDLTNILAETHLSPSATLPSGSHIMTTLYTDNVAAFIPETRIAEDLIELPLPKPCLLKLSLAWNTAAAEENPYIASVESNLEGTLGGWLWS